VQRRRFLAAAAVVGATALSGCYQSGESPPDSPPAPGGVSEWSFAAPVDDVDMGREQPPRVTCDPDADRVRVTGVTPAGNDCSALYPASVTYDAGTLSLTVAGWEPDRSCGEVMRVAGYEAVFEFDSEFPARVVALEQYPYDGREPQQTEREC
jgi:hypothetical protein